MQYPQYEAYARSKNHRRHCPGAPLADAIEQIENNLVEDLRQVSNQLPWRTKVDKTWLVCLYHAELVDKKTCSILLRTLNRIVAEKKEGYGGEDLLVASLGGDEDLGSVINYGRTLQEPMSRLQMRASMITIFDDLLALLSAILEIADDNVDTVMPGHTHLSQAQPITLTHYLLSVYDCIERGIREFEFAYQSINRNSGGCGANAGTLWPVDRHRMTTLLGMDELVEPTYDCEAAQDHSLSVLFALTNICITISRVAMDMNIWGMEEVQMLKTEPSWAGVSSLMPQKSIQGSQLERCRISACEVIAEMNKSVSLCKGEPHGDMLPVVAVPGSALAGMAHARRAIGFLAGMLKASIPQKERMLEYAREGYSAATDVAVYLVRQGYGNRRAHRIVATFVRMAREREIKAYEATGELMDEAADFVNEKPPQIPTETLRRLLDPVVFIEEHDNVGGTASTETRRMLAQRHNLLKAARQRHRERLEQIKNGDTLLQKEVQAIINE